jgi:hypothetical protein
MAAVPEPVVVDVVPGVQPAPKQPAVLKVTLSARALPCANASIASATAPSARCLAVAVMKFLMLPPKYTQLLVKNFSVMVNLPSLLAAMGDYTMT